MEFKIECPWCNQHYSVDDSFVGQTVKCSVCEKDFIVRKANDLGSEVPVSQETTSVIVETQPSSNQLYTQSYTHNSYGTQPNTVHVQQNVYIQQPQQASVLPLSESDKSRVTFALLGFFLGCLGFHSFYLGKTGNGIATILANFLCSPPVVIFFVGIELLNTTTDSQNLPLKDKDSPVPLVLGILMIIGGILLFFITIPFYLASASNN
jgi:hypothetical protein